MSKSVSIGDKVRVLTGKEEGIVRGIQKNIVEVEIEDGFIIPILDRELVVIHSEEKTYFEDSELNENPSSTSHALGDLFFAFSKETNQRYTSFLINQSQIPVYFTTYAKESNQYILLMHGSLKPGAYVILHHWEMTKLPTYRISWLPFSKNTNDAPVPSIKDISVKKKWLIQESQSLPLIDKKGKLFNLNEDPKSIEAKELKDAFFEAKSEDTAPLSDGDFTDTIVDLHMDALMEDHDDMKAGDKLNYQIDYFEKRLDAAIVAGVSEMTFIHGVGNGTLKHNIQKKLSGHPHVSYFKDAHKEKFGYGALLVKFK